MHGNFSSIISPILSAISSAYFVADKNNGEEIKTIGFYRDHKLVKSIDITSEGEHPETTDRENLTIPNPIDFVKNYDKIGLKLYSSIIDEVYLK